MVSACRVCCLQVGLVACNDYIILESCIYRILKKHFGQKPYYGLLLDFFHEVAPPPSSSLLLSLVPFKIDVDLL